MRPHGLPRRRAARPQGGEHMRYEKILVPYDGSEHSLHALQTAMKLVDGDDDARLCVLTVVPTPSIDLDRGFSEDAAAEAAPGTMDFETFHKSSSVATEHAKKSLVDDVSIELDLLGPKGSADAVASTSVARGILGYASMNGYDLIVMGRRGFKSVRGAVGSVCTEVLGGAQIPILTVQ
jgi:nucleotide-binding universal stress UspA family protein